MTEQLSNFLSFWEGKKFKKIIKHNVWRTGAVADLEYCTVEFARSKFNEINFINARPPLLSPVRCYKQGDCVIVLSMLCLLRVCTCLSMEYFFSVCVE